MRGFFAVYLRELRSYFTSPLAYVIIAVFMLIMGYSFFNILYHFNLQCIQSSGYMPRAGSDQMNVNIWVVQPVLIHMAVILLLIMPILTMKMYAEEKKQGTMELLMTSPLSNLQIVAGKFMGCFTVYALLILLTLAYPTILTRFSTPDIPPIFTGYAGLLLLGMGYTALGGWASSMTRDQMIAAVISFGMFLLLWVTGWGAQFSDGRLSEVLGYVSTLDRLESFVKGAINTRDIVYFITLILFGLAMTSVSIDSIRWKE